MAALFVSLDLRGSGTRAALVEGHGTVLPGAGRIRPRLPPVGGASLLGMRADQEPPPAAVVVRVCDGLAGFLDA